MGSALQLNEPENQAAEAGIVVVGSGPVAIRFVSEFLKRSPDYPVSIFGDEPWEPYNRVQLTQLLSGERSWNDLKLTGRLPEVPNLHTFWNNRIVSIDTQRAVVTDSLGIEHSYTKLILALGSTPRIPSIPGTGLTNVLTFRDLADTQALMGRQISSRKTVVIGGGLLGLEAARAMQRHHTEVLCIEHSTRLMFNQLDDEASHFLIRHLEKSGIAVKTTTRVTRILGNDKVTAIQLDSGETIPCDTVIISTGILPNTALVREAGISVGRGIRVNDVLQTSHENIYAIGECAEHDNKIYGLVSPGYEQAAVLADHLFGGIARYHGTTTANKLKVLDYPVFNLGENGDNVLRRRDQYVYRNSETGIYRKLVIVNGRLQGVIATGPWPSLQRVSEAAEKHRFIWPWQRHRFLSEGELWPEEEAVSVVEWPASATVCNCVGVTRGVLTDAMQRGADSVEKLRQTTGASSVCGSCQPLLAELAQSSEPQKATHWASVLLTAGVITVVAVLALFILPGMSYTRSVEASIPLDTLWRDGLIKQISGFTLLGLSLLISLLSLRKRIRLFQSWGDFPLWRLVHVVIGTLILMVIFAHTGFRLGNDLNAWLMLSFSGLLALGALLGGVYALEHRLSRRLATRLRSLSLWGHLLLLWSLPALLAFHIFKTYYY